MRKKTFLMVGMLLVVLAFNFLALPEEVLAFDKDTHQYVTFALAIRISCFTWDEANIIASSDQAVDTEKTTKPGFWRSNNRDWHAFGTNQEFQNRRAVLDNRWKNEVNLTKKLAELGQFLHFVQDRHAHKGYWWVWGHWWDTVWSNCPDRLSTDLKKSTDMAEETLKILAEACKNLTRTSEDVNKILKDKAYQDLMNKLTGKHRSVEENKNLIEDYLKQYFAGLDKESLKKKKVPNPADPKIPDPPVIKYDKDGEPIKVGEEEFAYVDPRSYQSDVVLTNVDITLISETDLALELLMVNSGTLPSLEGTVEIWVLIDAEQLVGKYSGPLNSLDPGQSISKHISVSTNQSIGPAQRALVWVDLGVDDLDASNGEFLTLFPSPPVGGIQIPVDKSGLLAPYIGLALTIIAATAATAIYFKRVKCRKEEQ